MWTSLTMNGARNWGKRLKKKYGIRHSTQWNASLMTAYLNDIQQYFAWSFDLQFLPFQETDEVVVKFSNKINRVMKTAPL